MPGPPLCGSLSPRRLSPRPPRLPSLPELSRVNPFVWLLFPTRNTKDVAVGFAEFSRINQIFYFHNRIGVEDIA